MVHKSSSLAAPDTVSAPVAAADSAHTMTIEALAAQVGMTVRNVRAYNSAGLLSPPTLRGRLGLYGEVHLAQLQVIRRLRGQGMTLERIKALVRQEGDASSTATWQRLGDLAHALAVHMPPDTAHEMLTVSDIENFWQHPLTPALLDMMERSGMQRVLPDGTVAHFNPSLRPTARRMAELGMQLEHVLEMQESLSRDLRLAIRSFLRQMLNDIAQRPQEQLDADAVQTLMKETPDLLMQVVQGMVPVLLQQEIPQLAKATQAQLAPGAAPG